MVEGRGQGKEQQAFYVHDENELLTTLTKKSSVIVAKSTCTGVTMHARLSTKQKRWAIGHGRGENARLRELGWKGKSSLLSPVFRKQACEMFEDV